jgi:hypothetical protein
MEEVEVALFWLLTVELCREVGIEWLSGMGER